MEAIVPGTYHQCGSTPVTKTSSAVKCSLSRKVALKLTHCVVDLWASEIWEISCGQLTRSPVESIEARLQDNYKSNMDQRPSDNSNCITSQYLHRTQALRLCRLLLNLSLSVLRL
jgi:hypothetical protein